MQIFRHMGIRGRLVLLVMAAFSLPTGLFVWHTIGHRSDMIHNAKQELLTESRLITAKQQATGRRADAILTELAEQPELPPGGSAAACSQLFAARLELDPEFVNIGMALPDGDVVCSAFPVQSPINVADSLHFQQALKSDQMVISDWMTGRIVDIPIIIYAKAARGESGQVAGVFFLSRDLNQLTDELVQETLPEETMLTVVDSNGVVVLRYPDPGGWVGRSAAEQSIFNKVQASDGEGTAEEIGLDGVQNTYGFTPLLATVSGNMTLWLSVPKEVVTTPAQRELWIGLTTALAVFIMTLGLLMWSGSRMLVRPLLTLSRSTARFEAGDHYALSGLPHTDDEIGRLAGAFDELTEEVITGAQRFRAVAEASLDALFILTSVRGDDGHIFDYELVDLNTRAEAMAGMTHDQAIGQRLCEILPFVCTDGLLDKYAAVAETGTVLDDEFAIDTPGIEAKWLRQQVLQVGDGIAISLRDITAWKEAAEKIQQQSKLREMILETSGEGILGMDREGHCTFINQAGTAMLQYTAEEIVGRVAHEQFHYQRADGTPYAIDECPICEVYRDGFIHQGADELFWKKDGTPFPIEFISSPLRDQQGELQGAVVSFADISLRKQAEEALRESEAKFRHLAENLDEMIYRADAKTLAPTYVNPAVENIYGYSAEEWLGDPTLWERAIHPEDKERVLENFEASQGRYENKRIEYRIICKDNSQRWVLDRFSWEKDLNGNVVSLNGVVHDISERVRANLALQESEEKFRKISASAQDAIVMIDNEGDISFWNPAAEGMFGYSDKEALGNKMNELLTPERYCTAHKKGFEHFRETGEGAIIGHTLELEALRKDGSEFAIELSLSAMKLRGKWNAVAIIRDVTERKQSEKSLEYALRSLKIKSALDSELIHATDEQGYLHSVCRVIVKQGGYRMAMVGYADDNLENDITLKASAGVPEGFLGQANMIGADAERMQAPMYRAMRGGELQVVNDILSDPGMALWHRLAVDHGLASAALFPIEIDGKVIGACGIYATEVNAFVGKEVKLLGELADKLAFGINALRTRAERDRTAYEHEHHTEILQKGMEQTIQAIADIVDARDPYTAGHERRVSKLSMAIAQEMGLSKDKIHGIRLAAAIHDMGKIKIPAEILSNPGKLTDIEFMLVKTHPQTGRDIIKDVEFPWPIADMVWQHHERMDGTGYPRGLEDREIRLEARIMAVADVIEAMSSHRPYRAALGIGAALKEIERGRGSLFDPAVADACLKLFREERFEFSDNLLDH